MPFEASRLLLTVGFCFWDPTCTIMIVPSILIIHGLAILCAQGAPDGTWGHKRHVVSTSYGNLEGNISEYRDEVYTFKGIPFAAPSTGPAR